MTEKLNQNLKEWYYLNYPEEIEDESYDWTGKEHLKLIDVLNALIADHEHSEIWDVIPDAFDGTLVKCNIIKGIAAILSSDTSFTYYVLKAFADSYDIVEDIQKATDLNWIFSDDLLYE